MAAPLQGGQAGAPAVVLAAQVCAVQALPAVAAVAAVVSVGPVTVQATRLVSRTAAPVAVTMTVTAAPCPVKWTRGEVHGGTLSAAARAWGKGGCNIGSLVNLRCPLCTAMQLSVVCVCVCSLKVVSVKVAVRVGGGR